MKKWARRLLIAVVALGGVGFAGYHFVINQAADRLSKQLASDEDLFNRMEQIDLSAIEEKEASDSVSNDDDARPSSEIADSIEPEAEAEQAPSDRSANVPNDQRSAPVFNSKQEAVKFVMSRFSAAEISRLSKLSLSDLTPEEKAELKALAYSRFTPAEIEAVRKAVAN